MSDALTDAELAEAQSTYESTETDPNHKLVVLRLTQDLKKARELLRRYGDAMEWWVREHRCCKGEPLEEALTPEARAFLGLENKS